ncbi:MAG TPA: hypothetical protein VID75_12945 [Acidimicrobiales bacterium]|jgi:hypothetical protein
MVASTGGAFAFLFLFYIAFLALLIVAWARILGKAGYNPWLCLLALIPFVNIVMFLVFAFSVWPRDRQPMGGYGQPPGPSSWGQPQPMTGYPPPGYPTPPPPPPSGGMA